MNLQEILALPVHDAAAVFPMLPDDELDELAQDIKANGLQQPIVIKNGVLIDGRNRRAACERAGVVPAVRELNGADPVAFIISSNDRRRHLTKGQRATVLAKVLETNTFNVSEAARASGVQRTRISQACVVVKWAPESVDGIINGAESLDRWYDIATQRKNAAEGPTARLETLRKKAPDLADKVVEEQLKLDEAEAASRAREDRERLERAGTWATLETLAKHRMFFRDGTNRDFVMRCLVDFTHEHETDELRADLEALHRGLSELLNSWEVEK